MINFKTCTRRIFWSAVALCALPTSMLAQSKVYDFENYEVGQQLPMWNVYGADVSTSKAEVVTDPTNAANKVLHVTVKDWNTFVTLELPKALAGHRLTDHNGYIKLDFMRPATDKNEWKQFHIYLGSENLYQDQGYPSQGAQGVWQKRQYSLKAVTAADNSEANLHLGIHSDDSEYYLDNIEIRNELDDNVIANDDTLDICESNTSDSYKVFDKPLYIDKGKSYTIKTSRYTYLSGKVAGSGQLNILSGGERTYLGNKAAKIYAPDWYGFSGSLHIYPYKEVEQKAGFYGMVWQSAKTFAPDNAIQSADEGNANSSLQNVRVVVHAGSVLASEAGKRCIRIGGLDTEAGSKLYGYYKSKASNDAYYLIGCDNHDATLAGDIAPYGGNVANAKVGIIKEGTGTYSITGNNNLITGALRVFNGTVAVNNDVAEASRLGLTGAIGQTTASASIGAYVMTKGVLAGCGNVGVSADVFGTLWPGNETPDTLRFHNYAGSVQPDVTMHPAARVVATIKDAQHASQLVVAGSLKRSNSTENFQTSDKKPRLVLRLADGHSVKVGDKFVLVTANSKSEDMSFDIRYPKEYTWDVKEATDAEGHYQVVAAVTSLEYGGQGDIVDDSDTTVIDTPTDTTLNIDAERAYTQPLREYALALGKYIGTCVSLYDNKVNVDDDNDAAAKLVKQQFNMVVCENEMKFDATEPNRNEFNYWNGDRLVGFASKNGMRVRGHALVWHSQVPQWLSKDGKKNDKNFTADELISIMQNHINNVVGHWKGKIAEWDVCNEVLDDDQSIVRSNPDSFSLRSQSVWNYAGTDYVEKAFRFAHEADPDAELILNDYGVEFAGQAKAEAFYNLAKYLKNKGVPISGVGLQCHLDAGKVDIDKLRATFERFHKLGLKCVITELDLATADTEAGRKQQALDFYRITKTALGADNCDELMVWGLTDGMSWRHGKHALMYNDDFSPKEAYYGMHQAAREAAQTTGVKQEAAHAAGSVKTVEWFNLQGMRLSEVPRHEVCIQRMTMSDNTVVVRKVMRK